MLFNSFSFIFFFLVVYGVYLVLHHKPQNVLLLLSSYFFYACWDWRFLSLIIISTLVDYICGIRIDRTETNRLKRAYLLLSMITNLGILFFFKYCGFFTDSAAALLDRIGFEPHLEVMRFVLPVGISFYTFQTMSYTIDIYRGQLKPTRDLLDFSVFVAFFPQLIAGPIERARHLLPQILKPRIITYEMIREGGWLILLGYFKKTVIADNMAPFVNVVFNCPAEAHGLSIPIAIVCFAFQIYGDFSGYSDIARGISKWMGFDIMVNFRMPYFASNPQEFWRRWHISLSTWLRDYLYISLGGNRGGTAMIYRNLILTMLLGGLWHGAAWHYVAWGAYHGLLLMVHRILHPWLEMIRPGNPRLRKVWKLFCIACFFILTCFGWFLFRLETLSDLPVLITNTFSPFAFNGQVALLSLAIFITPLMIIDLFQERKVDLLTIKQAPISIRLTSYLCLFMFILLTSWVKKFEFIYFQF